MFLKKSHLWVRVRALRTRFLLVPKSEIQNHPLFRRGFYYGDVSYPRNKQKCCLLSIRPALVYSYQIYIWCAMQEWSACRVALQEGTDFDWAGRKSCAHKILRKKSCARLSFHDFNVFRIDAQRSQAIRYLSIGTQCSVQFSVTRLRQKEMNRGLCTRLPAFDILPQRPTATATFL